MGVLLLVLCPLNLLREGYQFWRRRWAYVTAENLLELVIYIGAIVVALDYSPGSVTLHYWQWELGT